MKIIVYLKSKCERSIGICAIMRKYGLEYENRDIDGSKNQYAEMVNKSGQSLAPCVEINGLMLADTSGQEIEKYLLSKKLVKTNSIESDTSADASGTDEERDAIRSKTTRFF